MLTLTKAFSTGTPKIYNAYMFKIKWPKSACIRPQVKKRHQQLGGKGVWLNPIRSRERPEGIFDVDM